MTAYRLTEIWCDTCLDKVVEEGTFAEVREHCQSYLGWGRRGGDDICPKCIEAVAS